MAERSCVPGEWVPRGIRLLAVLAIILFIHRDLYIPLASPGVDYEKHRVAALVLLEHGNPYAGEGLYSFNYPLATGYLYIPLAFIPAEVSETVWDVANILMTVASALILMIGLRPGQPPAGDRACEVLRRHWTEIVIVFFGLFEPLQRVLLASNVDPLNLLLSSVFCVLLMRGRDIAGGVALAGLALVKVAPVFLLLPLASARRWRAMAACLGSLAVYAFLLLVTGAWRTEMDLYTVVLPDIPWVWRGISCSLHHFIADVFLPASLESAASYRRLVLLVNVLLMGVYFPLFLRLYRHGVGLAVHLVLGYSMLLAITPLLEINHVTWVIPGFFLLLLARMEDRVAPGWFWLSITGWMGLLMMETLTGLWFKVKPPFPVFHVRTGVLLLHLVSIGGLAWSAASLARRRRLSADRGMAPSPGAAPS